MKAELRLRQHSLTPGAMIVEVWYGGQFVAEVTGADGPGVRVISKYRMVAEPDPLDSSAPYVMEVQITS